MPAYHRVNIDGGYSGNPETWSTSFATTADASVTPSASLTTWADAIMTFLAGTGAGAPTLRGLLSSNGQIRRVRIYWYPSVGAPAGSFGASTAAAISGSGTVEQVPQVAMVISLLTGTPGGSYRGRMYWPAIGAAANTAGKIGSVSQGNTDNIALGLAAMASPTSPVLDTQLAVASQATGAVTPVTSIRIGDVADTQRRRRDALVETYYQSSV